MLHQTRRREISELFITEGYRTAQADDFLLSQKRSMKRLQLTILTGLSILLAVARPLHAGAEEAGVSSDSILFGQAAALEGPACPRGQGLREGILGGL